MACMLCLENNRERKWTCTWCQLRICGSCSDELKAVPGRDLAVLMEKRRALGVVEEEEEEEKEEKEKEKE